MLQTLIEGPVYVLGDNIDTDQIIPAHYLTYNPSIPAEYRMFGKFALIGVPNEGAGLPKGHIPFHGPDDEFVSPYNRAMDLPWAMGAWTVETVFCGVVAYPIVVDPVFGAPELLT